jgi:hypothetical protein
MDGYPASYGEEQQNSKKMFRRPAARGYQDGGSKRGLHYAFGGFGF